MFLPVLGDRYPELSLEWAPTSLPLDEVQTWESITDRLREWSWSYGRRDEHSQVEPGTGHVLLDNRDRHLDPSYEDGPWFGNIKPRRMFRLQSRWDGVTRGIFTAHARSYPQSYPAGVDNVVRVSLTDDLALLQPVDLDALGFDRPEERADERVNALLDEVDIPESRRDIGESAVTVAPTAVQKQGLVPLLGTALNQATSVVASEDAPLYVSGRDGKLKTFYGG